MNQAKFIKLDSILKDLRSFVVAFSGGVDSSFLIYRAKGLGRINMTAITLRTPYMPSAEIEEAAGFAESHKISHRIIDLDFPPVIRHNPRDRCYQCKKLLFRKISEYASENGFVHVIDGTNADDHGETRPGIRALRELSVRSPLAEAGLTKNEIREMLMKEGLTVWEKPASACLLTRIPYETDVSEGMLRMIEKAEGYLLEKGYPGTRVRLHGDVARIECMPGFLARIINDPEREQIIKTLKNIGFRYISLDLEGYRTGSMDHESYEHD